VVDLQRILTRLAADLADLDLRWALIGGLAVSVRTEPRTTRDIDVAVWVENDRHAESLVADLRSRGYQPETLLEQEVTGRLATVRLLAPGEETGGVLVDLLFASSGVEPEIVDSADLLEVFPDLPVPIAGTGALIALKILAGRAKDLADLETLLERATPEDLPEARRLLGLIEQRGCARNQDLLAILDRVCAE
jgi:hypothetical protein